MKRNYIGLANSFHDSAIAIANDQGQIVFAEATERYMQNKRAINILPDVFLRTSALIAEHCDPDAEIVAATSWSGRTIELFDVLLRSSSIAALKRTYGSVPAAILRSAANFEYVLRSQKRAVVTQPMQTIEYELSQMPIYAGREPIRRSYDHHLTHAAAACFTSPFDEAVCAVLDGYGEGRSYGCYRYKDGVLTELEPAVQAGMASLGSFYGDVCEACGFGSLTGDEWKVMGLASYGRFDPNIYVALRDMIRVNGLHIEASPMRAWKLRLQLEAFRRLPGEPPLAVANLAFVGQQVFTEVLFEFLSNLYDKGLSKNLVLGGGCALNSSANGRILEKTPFKHLYVFSAPADDGNAVGAALLAYQEDHPEYRPSGQFQSPYLGSRMSDETLANVKQFGGIAKIVDCGDQAPERAAQLLSQRKIVGWIQGRAEFGPRALGNRSILADPRSADIKDAINTRVKFREEFRPFAPSVLDEFGAEYFEDYQSSPYMERTLRFRPEVRERIAGVVHEDGTGRLQTVKREWNEKFYRLIRHFYELTGVPLVINTSFNVMGKPIVHSVEDVLAVFYTSGLDAVFVNNTLIEK